MGRIKRKIPREDRNRMQPLFKTASSLLCSSVLFWKLTCALKSSNRQEKRELLFRPKMQSDKMQMGVLVTQCQASSELVSLLRDLLLRALEKNCHCGFWYTVQKFDTQIEVWCVSISVHWKHTWFYLKGNRINGSKFIHRSVKHLTELALMNCCINFQNDGRCISVSIVLNDVWGAMTLVKCDRTCFPPLSQVFDKIFIAIQWASCVSTGLLGSQCKGVCMSKLCFLGMPPWEREAFPAGKVISWGGMA